MSAPSKCKCNGSGTRLVKTRAGCREVFCQCPAGRKLSRKADGDPTKAATYYKR